MTRKFKERLEKRNAAIVADYVKLRAQGYDLLEAKEMLANRYELTVGSIYNVLRKGGIK
ncbi:MAG: hypothetical protein IIT93_02710 [Paludibacteraceae bacterium]|nr:hypothetical protein [Paludibacteraceae bacterium]